MYSYKNIKIEKVTCIWNTNLWECIKIKDINYSQGQFNNIKKVKMKKYNLGIKKYSLRYLGLLDPFSKISIEATFLFPTFIIH